MESAISGLVNRMFGRVFRGHVELVELARKLGREMEDHKTVSVARVYVPNEYIVYLSPSDREHYSSFERSATNELADYLQQRARHDGFTLLSAPSVTFETDADLRGGEYGIACRMVDPPIGDEAGAAAVPEAQNVPFTPYEPPADLLVGDDDDDAPLLEATDISGDVSPDAPSDDAAPAETDGTDVPATDDAPSDDDAEGPADEEADDPLHGLFPLPGAAAAADGSTPETPDADAPDAAVQNGPAHLGVVPPALSEPAEPEPAEAPAPSAADESEPAPQPPPDESEQDGPLIAAPPIPPPPAEPRRPVVPPPSYGPRAPDPVVRPAPPKLTTPPLPPAATNEGLAGVSGTQMMPPAKRHDDDFVQEEVSLIIDGRRHRLTKRTTTIGRSRDCDVSINDANASRQHAEIRHIGLDYFLVDHGSTNGTYVNGQRVRRHAIANGDRVVIGTTEMIVEHVKVGRG